MWLGLGSRLGLGLRVRVRVNVRVRLGPPRPYRVKGRHARREQRQHDAAVACRATGHAPPTRLVRVRLRATGHASLRRPRTTRAHTMCTYHAHIHIYLGVRGSRAAATARARAHARGVRGAAAVGVGHCGRRRERGTGTGTRRRVRGAWRDGGRVPPRVRHRTLTHGRHLTISPLHLARISRDAAGRGGLRRGRQCSSPSGRSCLPRLPLPLPLGGRAARAGLQGEAAHSK